MLYIHVIFNEREEICAILTTPLFLQKHVRHTLENFFACLNTCAEVLFKTSSSITPLQI